jgi:hypothetical protein
MKTHRLLKTSLLALALAFSFTIPSQAAVPQAVNFQAVARKPDGTPIANTTVGLRVTIRRTAANGTIVYQERHTPLTTAGGQFNLQIGKGTALSGTFFAIQWATYLHFTELEIDPAGGTAYTNMGTQELVSVPYALNAQKSDAVSGTTGYIPRFDAPDSLASSSLFYDSATTRIGLNDTTPEYSLDVNGIVRGRTAVRSDNDVIAGGDVTAGGNVAASGAVNAGGNASVAGTMTVNGGKGIVYNASSGTNLKIHAFTTATFGAVLPGHGLSAEGSIVFGGSFTSPPRVFVGDIDVTGGSTGELYRVQLILYGATNNSCKARLLNTSPNPVNYTITWNCMAIGN